MKIHIYHSALATFKDAPRKGKKKKPKNLIEWPKKGIADIRFTPFLYKLKNDNSKINDLIKFFENIDLSNPDSPISVNHEWIGKKLGITPKEAYNYMMDLYEIGILKSLTINFNFRKWLQHSKIKGCLVVMVCVEEEDYNKSNIERMASEEVIKVYLDLFFEGKKPRIHEFKIKDILLVPNAHLSNKIGKKHKKNISIIENIAKNLENFGFKTKIASYGYPKDIHLAIIGHSIEYVLRCV